MKYTKDKNYHYVYKITNTRPLDSRKFYIGVHSCDCQPIEDTNYMGSSKYLDDAILEIGAEYFIKEIVSIWDTRDEAENEETTIQRNLDIVKNTKYYNLAVGNAFDGACNIGMVTCRDIATNRLTTIDSETYQNNKEKYIYHQTNKVNAFNIVTKQYEKTSKEDYYLRDELTTSHKNMVPTINIKTGNKELIDRDIFLSDKNLVGVNTNKVSVKDKNGLVSSVTKEEFNSDTTLTGVAKNTVVVENIKNGKRIRVPLNSFDTKEWTTKLTGRRKGSDINTAIIVHIFNKYNTLMFASNGNFNKICEDNNLPKTALQNSYYNHGEPIYTKITHKSSITILKNKDLYRFKGWFAVKISK